MERNNTNNNVMLKLILLQGFYWFAWAFSQYQTVYLQGLGMSSSYVGTLNAIMAIVAIFAVTFWGIVADKINSIKKTLIIVLALLAVLVGSIGFLPAHFKYAAVMFMIYCPLSNFARGSCNTLLDNISVRTCTKYGMNYGVIRSMGSFTFAVGSVLLSLIIIPIIGVRNTFACFGILTMIPLVITCFMPDPKMDGEKKKKTKVNPKELFKNYYYVTFIIFVLIVYIPFNSEYGFISYLMAEKGIATNNLGFVLALRAIMEMPFLIIMAKLRQRFKLKYLMVLGAVFIGVECFCLGAFAKSFLSFACLTSIFGLGNGIFIGTTSNYLYKLAPDHLKATAHSLFGACTCTAGVIGNFVGGFLFSALGGEHFYILLSGIIVVAVVFFVLSFVLHKGINPGDELG